MVVVVVVVIVVVVVVGVRGGKEEEGGGGLPLGLNSCPHCTTTHYPRTPCVQNQNFEFEWGMEPFEF